MSKVLRSGAYEDIVLLRVVKDALVPVLKLEVLGIQIDIMYCQVTSSILPIFI